MQTITVCDVQARFGTPNDNREVVVGVLEANQHSSTFCETVLDGPE
jgi:hypothetical protein